MDKNCENCKYGDKVRFKKGVINPYYCYRLDFQRGGWFADFSQECDDWEPKGTLQVQAPKRSYKDVLLEKFPKSGTNINGIPSSCVGKLFRGTRMCDKIYLSCASCWNSEYKEDCERKEEQK